jgi:hypothetical protein
MWPDAVTTESGNSEAAKCSSEIWKAPGVSWPDSQYKQCAALDHPVTNLINLISFHLKLRDDLNLDLGEGPVIAHLSDVLRLVRERSVHRGWDCDRSRCVIG